VASKIGIILEIGGNFLKRWQKFKLFWFLWLLPVRKKKPNGFKCAAGF